MKTFNYLLEGFASLIDIFGVNNHKKGNKKSVEEAILSDWEKIGIDMRQAFFKFENKNIDKIERTTPP